MKESMPQSIKSPSVFTIQDTIKRMEFSEIQKEEILW